MAAKAILVVQAGKAVDAILVDAAAIIVEGGKRVEWEKDSIDAPAGATFFDVAGAQIGWVVQGSTLVPPQAPLPPPDLGDLKTTMLIVANSRRDAVIAGGYHHAFGGTIGTRILDQRNAEDDAAWQRVGKIAQDLVSEGDGDSPMKIRDARNDTFEVRAMQVDAAVSAMGLWRQAISEHSWALKDAISAAATPEALAAIDIDAGWPE